MKVGSSFTFVGAGSLIHRSSFCGLSLFTFLCCLLSFFQLQPFHLSSFPIASNLSDLRHSRSTSFILILDSSESQSCFPKQLVLLAPPLVLMGSSRSGHLVTPFKMMSVFAAVFLTMMFIFPQTPASVSIVFTFYVFLLI